MRIVKAELAQPILLGRQGEHGATQVVFDLSGYIKTYGDGVAQLTVKRPGDSLEYMGVLTQTGTTAVWDIGPEWTEIHGQGYCYLHWFVDDDHAKSDTFKTMVRESKSACDAPEPQGGYLDQIAAIGAKSVKAAESAELSAAEVTAIAKRFDAEFAQIVEKAADNANTAAVAANQSATNAAASEQAAENAASRAAEEKQSALTAAGEAGASAEEAAAANEQAKGAAGNAQTSAENAAASEQAAAKHKSDAEAAAVRAEGYTFHPPIIGENGNWWTWDGEQYTDSGNPGKGEDATTRIVGEVVDDTLVLYTESGALIHTEVNGDTLCIG